VPQNDYKNSLCLCWMERASEFYLICVTS